MWLLFLLPALAGCAGPAPFRKTGASDPGARSPFLAGTAEVVFTPDKGYPLGGYGGGGRRNEWPFYMGIGWPGQLALSLHAWWHEAGDDRRADMLHGSKGVHDHVTAKALVLRQRRPRPKAETPPPVALVRIDAIGTTAELHTLAVEKVADLGYRPETVIIAATHTHSGPGAFMRAPMAALAGMDNYRPEVEERIAQAIADAIRQAHTQARPAALGFARARDRDAKGETVIAKNRSSRRFAKGVVAYDAVDDEIGLVWVEERETKRPIAVLVNYAVHPTVLGTDNLHYSADLTGHIERALSKRLKGTPVLFFNAAEGDVGPRRIKAKGGLLRCRELGEAFAQLALPALEKVRTYREIRVRAVVGEKELGPPMTQVALGRERFIDSGWSEALTFPLMLPFNALLWTGGATNLRLVLTWNLALGVKVDLSSYADRTAFRMGGLRLHAGKEDVALLCIPGEATHDLGLTIRAEAEGRGATRSFLLGLAQDHVGYIASREAYRRGGYEAHSTLFGPGAGDEILAAERAILKELGYAAKR